MFWTSSRTVFLHRLGEGEEFTVQQEFAPPGHTSADDTVVIVKCEPDNFAERDFGMRHREASRRCAMWMTRTTTRSSTIW